MNHRLYRCRHDRRLAGVASGLAEFFDLDPTLMRIIWFVSIFVTGGLSILLYFALAIIVPVEPMTDVEAAEAGAAGAAGHVAHRHAATGGSGRWATYVGIALILFGGLALVDALLPSWVDSWRYLGPAFVVGIGALLVVGAMRRDSADPPEAIGTPES
jgi:phage shock protein PspC (stress-responsive transcriptional regulator)